LCVYQLFGSLTKSEWTRLRPVKGRGLFFLL